MREIHCLISAGKNRSENVLNLIDIIDELGVHLHINWRGGAPESIKHDKLHIYETAENTSLSKARNELLEIIIRDKSIHESAIFAFVDDDGFLPLDFNRRIQDAFGENPPWLIGSFGPSVYEIDIFRFPREEIKGLKTNQIRRIASSVGLYVRFDILKLAGRFDENLGVGSRIPTGEDTEFSFRLSRLTGYAAYSPVLFQIHPYRYGVTKSAITELAFLEYISSKYEMRGILFRFLVGRFLKRDIGLTEVRRGLSKLLFQGRSRIE